MLSGSVGSKYTLHPLFASDDSIHLWTSDNVRRNIKRTVIWVAIFHVKEKFRVFSLGCKSRACSLYHHTGALVSFSLGIFRRIG
jgi:hypothetical protein